MLTHNGFVHRNCLVSRTAAFQVVLFLTLAPVTLLSQTKSDTGAKNDYGVTWVAVEGGTFTMGDGATARKVTVDGFMMSATEVTFAQYDAFCEATGKQKPDDKGWGRGTRPVINVSWKDIDGFCRWLSKETGAVVRLPNEAEWEYAARGGQKSKGFVYSGSNNSDEVAWNEGNAGRKTQPVGTKKPNELGLYDMCGNVWEWCRDWLDSPSGRAKSDSLAATPGVERAGRGSSYDNPARVSDLWRTVRAEVDWGHDNAGFRIVKTK